MPPSPPGGGGLTEDLTGGTGASLSDGSPAAHPAAGLEFKTGQAAVRDLPDRNAQGKGTLEGCLQLEGGRRVWRPSGGRARESGWAGQKVDLFP